jgi:hypothetical protein
MRTWFASGIFVLGMLLGPLVARADVAPPETIACAGKKAGDACADATTGAAGVCQDKTCVSPKPDGTSSSYACLQCLPGSKDDSGCAIGWSASQRRVGPWVLAGLVSLLGLLFRRRKGREPHR